MVRALASHQCGPGSNPGVDAICGLSLLLVLSLAPRVFFSGYSGFPLSSKTNISKFQFDQESGKRRTTMWMCYLQIVIYLFIYLFILFIYLFYYLFIYLLFIYLFIYFIYLRITTPYNSRGALMDHYMFLGNYPPTPPLWQHFDLSDK